jgi:hypothetical protein
MITARNYMILISNSVQAVIIHLNSSHMQGKSSDIFVPGAPRCMCMCVGLSIQSAVWRLPNRIIRSDAVGFVQGRIAQYQR